MPKIKIRVGHPAYSGANAMKYCFSKAAAVHELHGRGIKRDDARAYIKDICSRIGGYVVARVGALDLIEIGNYSDEISA
jgi:hypothetical protein